MTKIRNIFTIDLEEWFVVEIFAARYNIDSWDKLHSTVFENTLTLLKLLRRYNVKATWFVLGYCAERYPEMVQEVAHYGHEIACHSYSHRRVDKMTPDEFKRDTEKAVSAIIGAIGQPPRGYRAPSWSINNNTPWAFEILAEMGFDYDSSIFPIKHDIYGWPDGPTEEFKMKFDSGKTLIELPASTINLLGKNIPVAGGGYFRHSPYWYTKSVVNNLNKKGIPSIFYIHPWEVSESLPKLEGLSLLQKFRTYSSNAILKFKMRKLMEDFSFTTMADHLGLYRKNRIGF